MSKEWTIEALKNSRESEDKVEFKEAKNGTFPYSGGDKAKPADRRRCILGYVVAFCNEVEGPLSSACMISIHIESLARLFG